MRMHTLVIFQKILTISFILGKITKYAFFFKLYSYLTKLVSRKCLLSIRILLAQNDSKNNDLLQNLARNKNNEINENDSFREVNRLNLPQSCQWQTGFNELFNIFKFNKIELISLDPKIKTSLLAPCRIATSIKSPLKVSLIGKALAADYFPRLIFNAKFSDHSKINSANNKMKRYNLCHTAKIFRHR